MANKKTAKKSIKTKKQTKLVKAKDGKIAASLTKNTGYRW